MPRIRPLDPPYTSEVATRLESMMPAGAKPITLFRTFARNLPMAESMGTWGAYELGRRFSVGRREREIVIDRTCAMCGCEYEWGVHVAFFAESAGLSPEQTASLVHGSSGDRCWTEPRERALIDMVDALHKEADLSDGLWKSLALHFSPEQLLDLLLLCGWYHAISFVARGTRVDLEVGAPTFASVAR
jgi:alkylhydroperoxidase family enzyme